MGKCKDKKQENKLNNESKSVLKGNDVDSQKIVNDPYIQMTLVKNSDEDIKINENGGAAVIN